MSSNRDTFTPNRYRESGYRRYGRRGFSNNYRWNRNSHRMEAVGNVHEVPKKVFNVPPPTAFPPQNRPTQPDSALSELGNNTQEVECPKEPPQRAQAWSSTRQSYFPTLGSEKETKTSKKKIVDAESEVLQAPKDSNVGDNKFTSAHDQTESATIRIKTVEDYDQMNSLHDDFRNIEFDSRNDSKSRRGQYRRAQTYHSYSNNSNYESRYNPGSVTVLKRDKIEDPEPTCASPPKTTMPENGKKPYINLNLNAPKVIVKDLTHVVTPHIPRQFRPESKVFDPEKPRAVEVKVSEKDLTHVVTPFIPQHIRPESIVSDPEKPNVNEIKVMVKEEKKAEPTTRKICQVNSDGSVSIIVKEIRSPKPLSQRDTAYRGYRDSYRDNYNSKYTNRNNTYNNNYNRRSRANERVVTKTVNPVEIKSNAAATVPLSNTLIKKTSAVIITDVT